MDDFKLLLGTNESRLSPDNSERLSNACLVVNALGPKVGWGIGSASRRLGLVCASNEQRKSKEAGRWFASALMRGLTRVEAPTPSFHPSAVTPHTLPKVRDALMDWLCDREMTVYQTIFSMSSESMDV